MSSDCLLPLFVLFGGQLIELIFGVDVFFDFVGEEQEVDILDVELVQHFLRLDMLDVLHLLVVGVVDHGLLFFLKAFVHVLHVLDHVQQ